MEAQVQLAELDKFGEIECAVYRDGAGECYFTREQIGSALEYGNPSTAIRNIHTRHAERIDRFSIVVPLFKSGVAQNELPHSDDGFHPEYGGTQETTLYSRKGVMEICRWSRQPKADAFMDWVWEITDKLMSGEMVLAPENSVAAVEAKDLRDKLDSITGALDAMNREISQSIASLNEKVSKVQTASSYSNYYLRCQMRSGYDERWERNQRPRLLAIAEFIGIDEKRLLHEVYAEMECRYGISLASFVNDYKRTKKVTTCSTLSVISFSLTLREMFNAVVDEILSVCGIDLHEENV